MTARFGVLGTAIDLRPGDDWLWGQQGAIHVEASELTDDGLIRVTGHIMSGRDRGYRGSWSVQFTQPVEYARDSS